LRNNRLESKILQKVDELIKLTLEAGINNKEEREKQLEKGIALVQEMGDLLLKVLEGRNEHLQALLEQLVSQRLPERRILQSFGNFPHDIQYVIENGVMKYLDNKEGTSNNEGTSDEVEKKATTCRPSERKEETIEDNKLCSEDDSIKTSSEVNVKSSENEDNEDDNKTECRETSQNTYTEQAVVDIENGYTEATTYSRADGTEKDKNNMDTYKEALRLAIKQVYPNEEIISNYETRYGNISFFLPNLK